SVAHLDVTPRERRADGSEPSPQGAPAVRLWPPSAERRCNGCITLGVVRSGGFRRLLRPLLKAADRKPPGGNRRDARAERRRLESRRPRWFHERLCERLERRVRVGRARAVRLAAVVRALPGDLLRSGQVARFARVRGRSRTNTRR